MTQDILKRIAAGDELAVTECLDRYGGLVWSIARKLIRNADDAEDVVQEIFVDIWKNAARFDENKSSETTFIAMIAKRRLIDKIRHQSRRLSPDSLDDLILEPFTRADQALQTCIEAEQAAEAMRELRPEQQQVLRLSIVQGMSHQEISQATGIPLGTVKTHARRGLLQVRQFLGLGTAQEVAA